MSVELGVFIPVYNGGELLLETVASCLESPLAPERYRVLVVDNCSTDGAPAEVKRRFGSRVEVIRNETNLGRVGNWNRSAEIACERGFRFMNFLFVGDRWIRCGALAGLLDRLRDSEASLALAGFEIRDWNNRLIRVARRFTLSERFVEVDCDVFLDRVIATGTIPVAPLQADLIRVLPAGGIRFDPERPTSTDIESTVEFLARSRHPVLLSSEPFMAWRKHEGRFFMRNDLMRFTADDTAQLCRLSRRLERPVDWPVANALLVLKMALGIWLFVPPRKWIREWVLLIRHLRQRGGGLSLPALFEFAARHVLTGRSLLEFGARRSACCLR